VIVKIDAEPLSLFLRQVIHPEGDAGLLSVLLKTRSSDWYRGLADLTPMQENVVDDQHPQDDRDRDYRRGLGRSRVR